MSGAVELSVVVPVYGCEPCLRALHSRLSENVASITESYELIFVDDRSPDNAWNTLVDLAEGDARVRLIRLSRNFGQHPAITAGLHEASGRWVVVTDCDLEDPPEEIPRLYEKAQAGYDLVMCRRRQRRQSFYRRVAARTYRRIANFIAKTDIDSEYTNLSILSRRVVDSFLEFRDLDRQYLLMLLWLGYERATIEVDQADRYAGESAYGFGQLLRVAADGVFFETTRLLRWIVYTGFVVAAMGILLAGGLLGYSYFFRNPPPGYTSLGVLILVMSGVIVISAGVTGLYVGKIFAQVKGRPLYVVDEKLGGSLKGPAAPSHRVDDVIADRESAADHAVGRETS